MNELVFAAAADQALTHTYEYYS
eukprot:COSAG01_NODE_68250_length_264_cov_1.533333_1_plen_22_part_10